MANTTMNLGSIKDALYAMHADNNRHAIGVKDIEGLNVTKQSLDQWIAYVEELRKAVNAYIDVSLDFEKKQAQITKAQNTVFAKWSDVVKNGTDDEFNKRMFVRASDVAHLVFCGEKKVKTSAGSQVGHKTSTEFRTYVEWFIGCRLAQNAVMTDEDLECVETYERALSTIDTADKQLAGYVDKNHETVLGLIAQEKNAKHALADHEKLFKELKIEGDRLEELLTPYRNALKKVQDDKKDAEDRKAEAEKKRDDNQKRYHEIIEALNTLE